MALLGNLLKKGIQIQGKLRLPESSPAHQQKLVLRKLLLKAVDTAFGNHYRFDNILKSDNIFSAFREQIPIHDYVKMHQEWWHLSHKGIQDVAWPGQVNYFALSSGTSDASSKYIPVTKEMIKAIRRASLKQMYTLTYYNLPSDLYEKGMLMLGGSTHLNYNGLYFYGDLSGINAGKIPFWFQHFYKPGKKIASTDDWELKLNEIVKHAKEWDIWVLSGVPAWIKILLENIIEYYNLNHIHELWPNLKVYAWGGVSLEPYKKGFDKLLGQPLIYFETYLASEGFVAYDAKPNRSGMKMILNNGIYYEFIPFNSDNFEPNGTVKPAALTLTIDQVQEGIDYALLMSTCAGAWRYMIGDVIRFTSKDEAEIRIVGRTKHYISLCGEHLSVDNMNQAITEVQNAFDSLIPEFTVVGEAYQGLFAHRWYLGSDKPLDPQAVKVLIDKTLCNVNDDYKVERTAALKAVFVEVLPTSLFYKWMEEQGKMGGQHKFPRVLNAKQAESWSALLAQNLNTD